MSALTDPQGRVSSIRKVNYDKRPLSANVKAIKGGYVACDANGFYCPATGASTHVNVFARFTETVDNTGGADGAKSANVQFFRERTLFLLNNGTSALDATDRERPCYVQDDQTVGGDDTKSFGGIVYDVTSEGVWVDQNAGPRGPQGPAGA